MKRLPLLVLLFALLSPLLGGEKWAGKKMVPRYNRLTQSWTSYPAMTIRDIQYVSPESLAVADSLGGSYLGPRYTCQASPFAVRGDTVVVTCLVITPSAAEYPNPGITYTQKGWTMLVHDTAANSNRWGGALVRVGADNPLIADTTKAKTDGFNNVERGDIITLTVRVEEFPLDGSINTTTQLRPVPGIHIDILSSSNPIPEPTLLPVDSFYVGGYPGGQVNFHNGEAYEGSLVKLVHLTVFDYVNFPRGTWSMKDKAGNYIADLDASHYFTFGNENPIIPGDTSFHIPVIQGTVDTIKGTMLCNSGGENPRGYRICPLYPGDVKMGTSLPTVITHRRFPIIPTSADTVRVRAVIKQTPGGLKIQGGSLGYSIENAPWTTEPMSKVSGDTTYEGLILDGGGHPLAANTHVRYYIKGLDTVGNETILANSSFIFNSDTSKGFFFYQVLDRPLTIHDVQFTPYPNSRSAYVGALTTVAGVVTASSRNIDVTPLNTGGTSAWYIQNGSAPWSGIWVVKDTVNPPPLDTLALGDSVAVTGIIQEQFDVTRIFDSTFTFYGHHRPVPAPIVVNTGTFGVRGNGDTTAEKYEGVLIKVVNAPVSNNAPVFSDSTEYSIDDGSGPMLVRRDGINSYGNIESDTSTYAASRILHKGDMVDTIVGVGWFSFNRYKIVPRNNTDIVAGDLYTYDNNWNIVAVPKRQMPSSAYRVDSLYPGRTSPAFSYNGSYNLNPVLSVGKGFWLKFASPRTIPMLGVKVTLDTIPISAGWNLIGSISNPVTTSSIVTNPGNHLGKFFGYSGAYGTVTTLNPSKGYWVKADSNGYLVQSSPWNIPKAEPVLADFNSLKISDHDGNSQTLYFGQDAQGKIALRDYELPPSGPVEEGFDMRWSSGRILETYPAVINEGKNFAINLKAANGPLTVSWSIVGKDGKHFTLSDAENGKHLKPIQLKGAGTSIGLKTGAEKLMLRVDAGSPIPMEYSLGQNYPNPFNPTTTFIVALPEAAHLEVAVYNVLGQRVATLVDEVREAGYYPVTWNSTAQDGHAVSSGVYFVRMNAEKFTAVHKIMLLK